MKNKTILFVDDEKQILRALRRLFHTSDYTVLLAAGGLEALALLEKEKVDMLITDMRMPQMDGHELLLRIKSKYPDIIRIALSGYTDKKVVLSALDKNLAKIYLFKPWNNNEIINIIDSLFEFESTLKDSNLLDLVNNLESLPTIPELYLKISQMMENEVPVNIIANAIEEDPAIAARILRISNSAYFGSKTGDIKQAIMFIGLINVKNIILSSTVFKYHGANAKQLEEEFRHSSLTNKLLNVIYSRLMKKVLPNEAKSAGLLHNIGRGVILHNYSGLYGTGEDEQSINRENAEIGFNHQMIGSYILNWWELPLPIVECAMYHHNPTSGDIINKELVMAVHVAQFYASKSMGLEPEDDLSIEAFEVLGFKQERLEELLEEL